MTPALKMMLTMKPGDSAQALEVLRAFLDEGTADFSLVYQLAVPQADPIAWIESARDAWATWTDEPFPVASEPMV